TCALPIYWNNVGSVKLNLDEVVLYQDENGAVKLNGYVEIKFDKVNVHVGFDKCFLSVDNTITSQLSLAAKFKKELTLASVGLGLLGVASVTADLTLKIGFDGTATVTVTVKTNETVELSDWSPKLSFTQRGTPTVTAELHAKGYIKPNLKAHLQCLGRELVCVGAETGVEAEVLFEGTLSEDGATSCFDVQFWVPLRVYFTYDLTFSTWIGKFGWEGSKEHVFWDKKSSPVLLHWHYEDGVLVDKCTQTKEEIDDENFPPDGIEDDLGDSAYDSLRLSAYYVSYESGATANDRLNVDYIPGGYSASDLRFSSDNTGVVTVDGSGNLHIAGDGSALIRAYTSDGEYEAFCGVLVVPDFKVDFHPII
ncbi:MAG: hypothetical protein LBS90_01350, partial [Oscillospiraceae bacterium]|nr:hypothetical protein [Oscillospiraceae bacterium]